MRLEVRVDRDHAGAGGIERDGLDRRGRRCRRRRWRGCMAAASARHVIGVALRGVVGIFLLAEQRILGRAGAEAAPGAIEDGNANAEGAEIYSGDDAHETPTVSNGSGMASEARTRIVSRSVQAASRTWSYS